MRGGGRTHNLRLRRPTLYPIELRAQPDGQYADSPEDGKQISGPGEGAGRPNSPPQPEENARNQQHNCRHPPQPRNATRSGLRSAELPLHKVVVVEGLVGQVQMAGRRLVGPAGALVGPAPRATTRPWRHVGPAVRTGFRRRAQRGKLSPRRRIPRRSSSPCP